MDGRFLVCGFEGTCTLIKYSSLAQSVEHSAVNRVVVGSSPTGGAENSQTSVCEFFIVYTISTQRKD